MVFQIIDRFIKKIVSQPRSQDSTGKHPQNQSINIFQRHVFSDININRTIVYPSNNPSVRKTDSM